MAGSGCSRYSYGNSGTSEQQRRSRQSPSGGQRGRGIGSKENISLAEALCQTIGAELACSRPVAENEKWMEHERYVGISNLMLKPELYLADLRADPTYGRRQRRADDFRHQQR